MADLREATSINWVIVDTEEEAKGGVESGDYAKEETAQGIQSLRLVNLRRSGACYHRLFRPLTVYTCLLYTSWTDNVMTA